MKKYLKKQAVLMMFVSVLLILGMFAGCNSKINITTGLSSDELFKINKEPCLVSAAKLMLMNEKVMYEKSFGIDVWSQKIEGKSMSVFVKNDLKRRLIEIKKMKLYANNKGVALSISEIESLKKAADDYYKTLTKEELEYTKATLNDINDIYYEIALAEKVYNNLTSEIDIEISYEEAKMINVQHIFLPNYNTDESGNTVNKTKEELEELEDKVKQIQEDLKNGNDYLKLLETYKDYAVPSFDLKRGDKEKDYEEIAFSLKTEETSKLFKTNKGYYIIKCQSDYLEAQTMANIENITASKKAEIFNKGYNDFVKNIKVEFDLDLWESIQLKYDEAITSDSLIKYYEERKDVFK